MHTCMDCGKEISRRATRCRDCDKSYRKTEEWSQVQSKCLHAFYKRETRAGREKRLVSQRTPEARKQRSERQKRRWDRQGRKESDHCLDCGKELKWGSTRCRDCWKEYNKAQKYFCIDCGKEIGWGATRCPQCEQLARRKPIPKNYCVDCRVEICSVSTKCRQCAGIARRGRKPSSPGPWLGKKQPREMVEKRIKGRAGYRHSEETKRKISVGNKAAHARGCYDGAFQFPSGPELDLMAALEELGINYLPQYRIGTYPYDVCLPDFNTLIEYDGWFWHDSDWAIEHGFMERDKIKDNLAKSVGFELIRLKSTNGRDLTKAEMIDILQRELSG